MPTSVTLADDLKLILKFQELTALFPKYDSATRKFKKQTVYSGVFVCGYSAWLLLSIFLKYYYLFSVNAEDVILYGIPSVVTALANIIVLWKNNLSTEQDCQVIFDRFNAIDSNWKTRPGRVSHAILDFSSITLISLAMTSYNVYNVYFLGTTISFYMFFFNDKAHLYMTFILVLFQRYILRGIKVRSGILNGMIERADFDCLKISTVGNTKRAEVELRKIIMMHSDVCDAADCFNRLFGWNVLFSMLQILVGIVAIINLILYYFTSWLYLGIPILWNIYITAQGVLLTRECEHVSNECEKTTSLCYKAAQRFCGNTILRDKFLLLAAQAAARQPRFSAAGFFNIDYSMIFIFVNIIATYVIVLIQFKS